MIYLSIFGSMFFVVATVLRIVIPFQINRFKEDNERVSFLRLLIQAFTVPLQEEDSEPAVRQQYGGLSMLVGALIINNFDLTYDEVEGFGKIVSLGTTILFLTSPFWTARVIRAIRKRLKKTD